MSKDIKKYDDLQTFICTTQCMYGKRMKMAWDDMYWEKESNKNNPQMRN
jgi:hypothetical protein